MEKKKNTLIFITIAGIPEFFSSGKQVSPAGVKKKIPQVDCRSWPDLQLLSDVHRTSGPRVLASVLLRVKLQTKSGITGGRISPFII